MKQIKAQVLYQMIITNLQEHKNLKLGACYTHT